MAPPATEIAYITLKPGVDLDNETAEAKAWVRTDSPLRILAFILPR
jgi:hypothetical protein